MRNINLKSKKRRSNRPFDWKYKCCNIWFHRKLDHYRHLYNCHYKKRTFYDVFIQ